jgi:hypothetical protein
VPRLSPQEIYKYQIENPFPPGPRTSLGGMNPERRELLISNEILKQQSARGRLLTDEEISAIKKRF